MNEQPTNTKSWVPFPRLFNWRNVRRGLVALAVLITVIALAGLEETWRGKRAMDHLRAVCEAKGQPLDLKFFSQPAIPDEQNFGASPFWKPLFNYELNPVTLRMEWRGENAADKPLLTPYKSGNQSPADLPSMGTWRTGKRINLAEWQAYYRAPNKTNEFPVSPNPQTPAEDVLLALSRFDSNLAQLRECAARPLCRYPVHYEDGFNAMMPHLSKLKSISQFLYLRIAAELEANQVDRAFEDLRLLSRTTDSLSNEPLLIAYLVAVAMENYEIEAVWNGLSSHKWNDEQLALIESDLGKRDLLKNYKNAMAGERACMVSSLEAMRQGRIVVPAVDSDGNAVTHVQGVPAILVPFASGFFFQNELTIARIETEWLDAVNFRASEHSAQRLENVLNSLSSSNPYHIMATRLLPAFGKSETKGAQGQSDLNLARIACALERYRLANSCYPENLAALAPKLIDRVPTDVVNDQPLKYRRASDTQFTLYSVGWNLKDDGGVVGVRIMGNKPSTQRKVVDLESGDWVWSYEPHEL